MIINLLRIAVQFRCAPANFLTMSNLRRFPTDEDLRKVLGQETSLETLQKVRDLFFEPQFRLDKGQVLATYIYFGEEWLNKEYCEKILADIAEYCPEKLQGWAYKKYLKALDILNGKIKLEENV